MLLLPLLLLPLGLCSALPADALKKQKAEESPPVPLTLISCTVSSLHPSGLKIIDVIWNWKSQVGEPEPFKFKGDCQESSSFCGSNLKRGDASLQLLVVRLWGTEKHCCEMVNTSSKSQESISLQIIAQPNSTVDGRENIMVTCTSSCFSPQNTIRVLKDSPVNISCTSEQKDNVTVWCDLEPSALLTRQAGNSIPTGPETVNTAIAIPVPVCVAAFIAAVLLICCLCLGV